MTTVTVTAGATSIQLTGVPWCKVPDGSGLLRGAAVRTQDQVVPGIHGEAVSVLQVYGPGSVVVPVIVFGVDRTTGVQSGDGTAQLRDNLRYLGRVVHAPQVTLTHGWPDSQEIECLAKLRSEPFEGERWISSPPAARINIPFGVPGAFWRDVEPVVSDVYTLATGGTAVLDEFADASAPMGELMIAFGPCSNPRLRQVGTDTVVGYQGIISSGRQLTIDTVEGELGDGTGTSWTPDYSGLRYGPWARWFQLDPRGGSPTIQLEHTGGGTATVQITGRRKYMIGG